MTFPNFDSYGKRIKGSLRLFIASIYHPDDPSEYSRFNDELTSILSSCKGITPNTVKVCGHDINATIGIRKDGDENISKVLGPFGLDKPRNEKGWDLIEFLTINNLSVMNTFFCQNDYSTFFTPRESAPCMLDIWTTSDPKRFKNCKVCTDFGVMNSDHLGAIAEFSLTSIRDNREGALSEGVIDWKTIQYDEEKKPRVQRQDRILPA